MTLLVRIVLLEAPSRGLGDRLAHAGCSFGQGDTVIAGCLAERARTAADTDRRHRAWRLLYEYKSAGAPVREPPAAWSRSPPLRARGKSPMARVRWPVVRQKTAPQDLEAYRRRDSPGTCVGVNPSQGDILPKAKPTYQR